MRLGSLKQTGAVMQYAIDFQKLDGYIKHSDVAERIDRFKRGLKEYLRILWIQHETIRLGELETHTIDKDDPEFKIVTIQPTNRLTTLSKAIKYATFLEAYQNQ